MRILLNWPGALPLLAKKLAHQARSDEGTFNQRRPVQKERMRLHEESYVEMPFYTAYAQTCSHVPLNSRIRFARAVLNCLAAWPLVAKQLSDGARDDERARNLKRPGPPKKRASAQYAISHNTHKRNSVIPCATREVQTIRANCVELICTSARARALRCVVWFQTHNDDRRCNVLCLLAPRARLCAPSCLLHGVAAESPVRT